MKDNTIEWLNRLIDEGKILFVEGKDVRTPEAGREWQWRAAQFKEEAKAWVKVQSPADAWMLKTLSPYRPVDLDPGNPWWTPTLAFSVASCRSSTSSIVCEENHPVSYHLALINELEEIVSNWRAKTPEKAPKRFALSEDVDKGYSEHVKNTRAVKGRAPTEPEDIAWGKENKLGRNRVMWLRDKSPDRTDKDRRKGNRPKK